MDMLRQAGVVARNGFSGESSLVPPRNALSDGEAPLTTSWYRMPLHSIAVTPELRDCARSNVTPELRDCQSSYPLPFWLIVHYSYFGPSMQNACIQIRICKSWQVSWPYGQVTCVVADHSFKLSTVEKAKPNEGTHMISSCHGEPFFPQTIFDGFREDVTSAHLGDVLTPCPRTSQPNTKPGLEARTQRSVKARNCHVV